MQLTNRVKTILAKTAVAAGATDITDASVIDMQGYEGARFIFALGAIVTGAATSVAVAGKDTNSPTPGSDDLANTKVTIADDGDDKVYIVDVYKPRQRYLRPFVKRATQNATLNAIVVELYGRKGKLPVTADASVGGQESHVSPAVGTA